MSKTKDCEILQITEPTIQLRPLMILDTEKSKNENGKKSFLGRPFSYMGYLEREERPNKYGFMDGVPAYGEW